MKKIPLWFVLAALLVSRVLGAEVPVSPGATGLADTVVLIIRHAEKPPSGYTLTPAGEKRAAAYVDYFKNFKVDSEPLVPNCLFAAKDSDESHRPRLTIEPLSKAMNLPIDTRFNDKAPEKIVAELRAKAHGNVVLISWRHSGIPKLINAFGGDPALIPNSRWPEEVFDWVILLRFDHDGKLIPDSARRIKERLMPGDSTSWAPDAIASRDPGDRLLSILVRPNSFLFANSPQSISALGQSAP
jgi:hypothetical protein